MRGKEHLERVRQVEGSLQGGSKRCRRDIDAAKRCDGDDDDDDVGSSSRSRHHISQQVYSNFKFVKGFEFYFKNGFWKQKSGSGHAHDYKEARHHEWKAGKVKRHQCKGDHTGPKKKARDYEAGQSTDFVPARKGPEIWLPYDLILERLPVQKRCQLRCVCKAWNVMLSKQEVLFTEEAEKEQEFWFVMARAFLQKGSAKVHWEFLTYSSLHKETERPFFRPPLPNRNHCSLWSLLGGTHCRRLAFEQKLGGELGGKLRLYFYPPLASAGGLMSAVVRRPGGTLAVVVFNCLTGSVQVLRSPFRLISEWGTYYVFMKVDNQDSSWYHIMLSDSHRHFLPSHFEIFNSRNNCWSVGCNFSKSTVNDFSMLKVTDGDFFFLEYSSLTTSWLLAYHVSRNAWSRVLVPTKPCKDVGLVSAITTYKGRVRLGLPLFNTSVKPRRSLGFGVWELQLATSPGPAPWVEVARTPQHLLPPPTKVDWSYELASTGPLFYLTSAHQTESRPPLVFDMAQNSWYCLPSDKSTKDFLCIMVHDPKFSSPAGGFEKTLLDEN